MEIKEKKKVYSMNELLNRCIVIENEWDDRLSDEEKATRYKELTEFAERTIESAKKNIENEPQVELAQNALDKFKKKYGNQYENKGEEENKKEDKTKGEDENKKEIKSSPRIFEGIVKFFGRIRDKIQQLISKNEEENESSYIIDEFFYEEDNDDKIYETEKIEKPKENKEPKKQVDENSKVDEKVEVKVNEDSKGDEEPEEAKEGNKSSKILEEYRKRIQDAKTAKDYKMILKEVQSKLRDQEANLAEFEKEGLKQVVDAAQDKLDVIRSKKLPELLSDLNETTSEFNRLKNAQTKRNISKGISELDTKLDDITKKFENNKKREKEIKKLKKDYKEALKKLESEYKGEIDKIDDKIDEKEKTIIEKDAAISKKKTEKSKFEKSPEFKRWKKQVEKFQSELIIARLNGDEKRIAELNRGIEQALGGEIANKYQKYGKDIKILKDEKDNANKEKVELENKRKEKEKDFEEKKNDLETKLNTGKSKQEKGMVKQTFLSRTIGRIGSIVDFINVGKRYETVKNGIKTGINVISENAKDFWDDTTMDIKEKIAQRTQATQSKIEELKRQQENPENETEKNKGEQSNEEKSER